MSIALFRWKDFHKTRKIFRGGEEIWFFLPLFIYILNAIFIFDGMIKCSSYSQRMLSWTVFFPLTAAITSFLFGWRERYEKGDKGRIRYQWEVFFFLIFIMMALSASGWTGNHVGLDLHLWFEISTGGTFFLYLLHGLMYEGKEKTLSLFGVGLIYGLILENGGIILGFFMEEDFHVYLPYLPAPFFTAMGWCNVFYSCRFLTIPFFLEKGELTRNLIKQQKWKRTKKIFSFSILLTLMALLLDLQLDPFASHHQLWVWNDLLKGFFGGVPFINFTAWVSAIFPFAFTFRFLEMRQEEKGSSLAIGLLMAIPVITSLALGLVLLWTWLLEGMDSATMKIFREGFKKIGTFSSLFHF